MGDMQQTNWLWRRRVISWAVLGVYWPLLFVSTHLSPLRLQQMQFHGRDVFLHAVAFLILGVLYWLARHGVQRVDLRTVAPYSALALISLYGAIDEITQTFVGRTGSYIDWISDVIGCAVGLLLLFLVRRWVYWLVAYWAGLFALTHWPGEDSLIYFLPEYLRQFHVACMTASYALLTVLFVRVMSPKRLFVVNWRIMALSLLVLLGYAVLDQYLQRIVGREFDELLLAGSVMGVLLGVAVSAALARHHVVNDLQ